MSGRKKSEKQRGGGLKSRPYTPHNTHTTPRDNGRDHVPFVHISYNGGWLVRGDEVQRRKNIRLSKREYLGTKIYFLTICCEKRVPLFADVERARQAADAIRGCATKTGFRLHAYCVMPDHVHVLVEGSEKNSDCGVFVNRFRQKTGFLFGDVSPGKIWQRSYYDHLLRKVEDCDNVAWYIWMNPVRKGIAQIAWEYEFSGSATVEWPPLNSRMDSEWTPPWKMGGL